MASSHDIFFWDNKSKTYDRIDGSRSVKSLPGAYIKLPSSPVPFPYCMYDVA